MFGTILIALLMAAGIAVGYVAHREHLRATDLQATVDDQADTAAVHLERIAELEGRLARQRKATETANAAAERSHRAVESLETLLTAEIARNKIHEDVHTCLPTLPGIATHGVPEPVGAVVDDEPTWTGLVRDVAEVVELRGRKGRRA